MDRTVFHGTSFNRAQQILKEGIMPNSGISRREGGGGRYTPVAEQLRSAGRFGIGKAWHERDDVAVVFAVRLPESALTVPDRLGPLPYARDGKYWKYKKGRIPPSRITIAAFYRTKDLTDVEAPYNRVQSVEKEQELIGQLKAETRNV